ncbi:MAG: RsmD family RNA methyltransferase [Thermoproteus sp.]|nr:RsmD family RNA methyltransferase [Thermoproteus sp.]
MGGGPKILSKRVPVISRWQILDLLNKNPKVSFDLELTITPVTYEGGWAIFVFDGTQYRIRLEDLPEVGDDACEVYAYDGGWVELSIAADRYYKLCLFRRRWAPTLMIDGITMHSVLENPLDLVARKTTYVRGRVFECCTGLGYTSIAAVRRGARYVLTVEVDFNVLTLASYNPYSSDLFRNPRIDVIVHDATSVVKFLKDASFDYIIHDPPRLSYATQALYSEPLYAEYRRVLRRGGGLFHYTGATGSKYRGIDVGRGVAERLRKAGFRIERVDKGFGVFATAR